MKRCNVRKFRAIHLDGGYQDGRSEWSFHFVRKLPMTFLPNQSRMDAILKPGLSG
jgi:hypothetical protein